MTNILLILAVIGMLVGVYAFAMPTLTRKGWRLPFAGFFSEADEGEDEAFQTAFEMPRAGEMPPTMAAATPPMEQAEPLPPVLAPVGLAAEEDDPTLTPLFAGLDEEAASISAATEAHEAVAVHAQAPHLVVVQPQPAAAEPPQATPEHHAEEPQPEPEATGDDMLSLFSEAADAGKGPNRVHEAAGDVSITDLMEEVRKLRELLDNNQRAA